LKILSLNKYLFPIGLALIATLLIFIISPPVNQRLNIKLVETQLRNQNQFYFYEDLDNDGISEEIRTFLNSEGKAAIDGYFEGKKYMNQWNFAGTFTFKDFICFYDINKSGVKDVIFTTCEKDTIRLNIFNPITEEILLYNFPLIAIRNKNDLFVYISGIHDIDGNGKDEIILTINAGYSLQPRKILSYEFTTGNLKTSPLIGGFIGVSEIKDIDNDGKSEILIQSHSTDNYKTPVPYSDNSSWSLIFDHNLNIVYTPIENPVHLSVTQNAFFQEKDGKMNIIVFFYDQTKNLALLKKSDLNGNILKEIELPEIKGERYYLFNDNYKGQVYLYNAQTGYLAIDSDFEFASNIKPTSTKTPILSHILDIDQNGKKEYISDLMGSNGIYLSESLKEEAIFLPLPVTKMRNQLFFSFPKTRDNKYNFYLQADTQGFFIKYAENQHYWIRYLIYLATFLGLFVLTELVRWQQRITLREKTKREKELVEWQLQSIRNQLDPHFTFNALNAIGSAIYKEEKEVAYDIFTKFSHLFRKSLEDGNKLTRTLKEETAFVKSYLTIQKFRFPDVFDFDVSIEETVDKSSMVPKLVIQNFVENSIYHGLIPRKTGGLLNINISKNKKNIVVIILDNGVGRAANRDNKKSTGKGMELLQNYFDLLNKNNTEHLTYNIIDLYEGDKPVGTKVELTIPINFRYN
jgi:hypothetical protein